MKMFAGLLVLLLAAFQLFFRYKHWTEPATPGVVYERDTLTGQVHRLEPGQKVDFIARLLGDYGKPGLELKSEAPEPVSMAAVGTTDRTESAKNDDAVAAARMIESFVTRQLDLNLDGSPEEIIQSVTADDGLLDISIVKEGKELFYARGQQLHVLPSRETGWADLMLSVDGQREAYFRYQPRLQAYKRLEQRP